jgi:serine/threonine protein kinase/DNA-binding beta-propeller fold protein YncE
VEESVTEDVPEESGEDSGQEHGGGLAGYGPGSRIAGYVLEEQVGAGGMAVVFRAHDVRLDRQVALKILAPALAADQNFRQRFIRESRAAAAVDDPHIIPVFEAGEAAGVLFIAMRYVRGGDVRALLVESGPLPPARVAEIIFQVSSALDAAHDRGLVHRDVKPGNMLLDSRTGSGRPDHVYLSDFGLSKATVADSGLTGTGTFLGTVDYVAPEQIEGKPVDGRADQYALACAAFELLTGSPPFRRDAAIAAIYAHMSEPAPMITTIRPGLPPAMDAVFARALAKAAADRWPRCQDFARALLAAVEGRPVDFGSGQATPEGVAPATGPATVVAGLPAGPATLVADLSSATGSADPDSVRTVVRASREATQATPQPGLGGTRRPAWRSPAVLTAAAVVLLAAGGGIAYTATRPGSAKPAAAPSSKRPTSSAPTVAPAAAFLPAPACGTPTAAGKTLTAPTTTLNLNYGNPYDVAVSNDGKYVFATTATSLSVLTMNPNQTISAQYHYVVASSGEIAQGLALTSDGSYAAVAVGNQINIQSTAQAEQDANSANAAGLVIPDVSPVTDATEVVFSQDGQFAFVSMRNSNEVAVFNMQKALTTGQNQPGVFVGTIWLGINPTGMAVSPDGQWLYVVSAESTNTTSTGANEGHISVLSIQKLETKPDSALVSQATAGCSPTGVVASTDGSMVWVTARGSDELLGFSADKLRTDPKHSLTAEVPVGQTPTGVMMADGGKKILVADADLNGQPGADNIAVIDAAAATARKPALIGYIPSGRSPDHFVLSSSGQYLYVADSAASQVQIMNISALPSRPGQ